MVDQDRLADIEAWLGKAYDVYGYEDATLKDIAWAVAEVDRLRGLLASLEWAGSDYVNDDGSGTPMCPVCKRWRPAGHAPGCELAEVLGRTQKGRS